jgi:hypothetical protein
MPEEHLCDLARQTLTAGRISRHRPDLVWGGPGSGVSCLICARPIPHGEMDFEVEWVRGDESPRVEHLDRPYLAAWVFERLAAAG